MIEITIQITPACKHKTFDEACADCQRARLVARAFVQRVDQTDGFGTKAEVIRYMDDQLDLPKEDGDAQSQD